MAKEKRSFFERLTGSVQVDDDNNSGDEKASRLSLNTKGAMAARNGGATSRDNAKNGGRSADRSDSTEIDEPWQEEPEGQLTIDVHQTPADIIIKTMVAGVRPEDLDISITRDMVTIKGKRESEREVAEDDYFFRELYWGSFSRTILLPQEIEVEEAEASEKYGLLTIKLPKIDKGRQTKLKVKSTS